MTNRWRFAWAWTVGATLLGSCGGGHRPPSTTPPTPPPDLPPGGARVCSIGEVCGCAVKPPGQDWQALPPCSVDPAPTPVPPATPPPAGFPVRFPLQGVRVYANNKPYSQGFDSTLWVEGDGALCKLLHGDAGHSPCHFDSTVWGGGQAQRAAYEALVYAGARDGLPTPATPLCPVWQFRAAGLVYQCHNDHNALASCDHFGNTVYRDDPQTHDVFEGEPKFCAAQSDTFGPYAGFFTIAHGAAELRVCPPLDIAGPNCGPWLGFDH